MPSFYAKSGARLLNFYEFVNFVFEGVKLIVMYGLCDGDQPNCGFLGNRKK